ncbi:MAG: AAA family ATPase [Bacilli bacterium]|nr:AAA family ATPase [Bacilli bacterium]
MFYRKISQDILQYFNKVNDPILLVDGARQVGKTYIIRKIGKENFKNFIEINLANDFAGNKYFNSVKTIEQFYNQLTAFYGNKLGNISNTLIFLDEIQVYPELLTLLKPLREDGKFRYICSGSQLGVSLRRTSLIPVGSVSKIRMYPMDFEEFLLANGIAKDAISSLKLSFYDLTPQLDAIHDYYMSLFKTYLIVGGLPGVVKTYIEDKNIARVRQAQTQIKSFYEEDASQYDDQHRLKIKRIYNVMASTLENKVKRMQIKSIEDKKYAKFEQYSNEFEYLISSGIALECRAISEPKFPLLQSQEKNLLKLYYNDVGILTNILFKNNINPILNTQAGVNLGSVYETVVAQELLAHHEKLFYFDKRKFGEVDFLIDDYDNLCPLPIEVKSGRDYLNYKAMPKMLEDVNYKMVKGIVLSNERQVFMRGKILHLPIYYVMFL